MSRVVAVSSLGQGLLFIAHPNILGRVGEPGLLARPQIFAGDELFRPKMARTRHLGTDGWYHISGYVGRDARFS